ncbi:integrase [Bacillus phage vB_BcoS-136]|uniref:Integrase n=1 Tax=Bacillus phage vB_BcoS-136 TaxID=2419619 RepID=A0A3G3BVH8_9CAUD|nr:integrase [Bacillus phage vB_BcoS-136]AYP68258.1 tyrosine recombinase [Bacillus phage vB_BcoS-136]
MSHKKIEEVSDEVWENEINFENKQIIEEFLQQGHLSNATLKQYRSGLRIFAKWIEDYTKDKETKKGMNITDLKPRDALRYQNWLISKKLSSSAIKFKRSAVSSLCNYIELYYNDLYPDFRNIFTKAIPNVAKSNVKEKQPLTTKEINTIVKELEKRNEWQKIAYVWFTYSTGCRREESRQLLAEVAKYEFHVDKKGNVKNYYTTHYIRAKGKGQEGKLRKFTFDEKAMNAIKKWMEIRKETFPNDDCEHLFVSKTKEGYRQLSANTFNLWCKEFSKYIGGKAVHPHLFRSSRATNIVVEEGKDIKKAQKLLGHESSQTTEIYVVRDDSDDLDDLY